MNKQKSHLYSVLIGLVLWFVGTGIVSASIINISLDPNDWELDPHFSAYQSSSWSKTSTAEGLQVKNNVYGGGFGGGAFVRTVGSYNAKDAIFRYKWKAIDSPQYANYWNGYDNWTVGAKMTTHHSWDGSLVIPDDTWIYAQAFVGTDLSWYYNFSYTGYSDSGGFRSASGVTTNTAWVDSFADVQFRASVNDDYNPRFGPGAGVVISEMTLETPGDSVPEPATLALMGLGLAGIGFARKRRQS